MNFVVGYTFILNNIIVVVVAVVCGIITLISPLIGINLSCKVMHFSISRGTLVDKLLKKCFCQQTIYSSKNSIQSQKSGNLFFTKHYCVTRTVIYKAAIRPTQFLPLLTNMSSLLRWKLNYSTSSENKDATEAPKLSLKDKLKRTAKDYGATVMVFHISISLASLGLSYLVISSGVDVASLLDKVGFPSTNQVTTGASTFVVAYAVHKVFAPVRISITLGCTPFIVRYLRRVGILKPPKPSKP